MNITLNQNLNLSLKAKSHRHGVDTKSRSEKVTRKFNRFFFFFFLRTDNLVTWKRTLSPRVQITITFQSVPKVHVLVVGTIIWDGDPWRSTGQERLGRDTGHWIWKDSKDTVLTTWQLISGSVVPKELPQEIILK